MKYCKYCNQEKHNMKTKFKCLDCVSEQLKKCKKIYKQNNKEKIAESKKEYRINNKEKCSDYDKQYYHNNKEKKSQNFKIWSEINKDYRNKYQNERDKIRRKIDPTFKLRCKISISVSKAMKRNNSKKKGSVMKSLPYTIQELKDHLEKQFDQHMSWSNHGSYWHIDHIIPQSLLPYTSMEDHNFKKCWSLSNLQPLEKIANIKKGNRFSGKI